MKKVNYVVATVILTSLMLLSACQHKPNGHYKEPLGSALTSD